MDVASKTNNVEGSMDMKIMLQSRCGWSCLVIAALAVSTSGCKSAGFSMPGKNMFSWNRQPDAATLAGNTKVPTLPESPAAKYDPAAIASKSSSLGKPAGSAYGYGGASTAPTGSGSTQPGGAALANGYQSGPYPLASGGPAPTTTAASTATTGALPSPYGGTYNGSIAGLNTPSTAAGSVDVPLPSSVAAALGKGAGAPVGYTASAMPGGGLPALPNAASGSVGTSINALPIGYSNPAQTTAATTAYQLPTFGQTPALPPSSGYAAGSAANSAGLPALPGNSSSNTAAAGQTGSAAAPPNSSGVYPSTAPANSYSPGSTGRSTSYDFSSQQAAGTTATSAAPGGTLPLLR